MAWEPPSRGSKFRGVFLDALHAVFVLGASPSAELAQNNIRSFVFLEFVLGVISPLFVCCVVIDPLTCMFALMIASLVSCCVAILPRF